MTYGELVAKKEGFSIPAQTWNRNTCKVMNFRRNNIFNLELYRMHNGDFTLVLHAKILFSFGTGWTDTKKSDYVESWILTLQLYMQNKAVRVLKSGATVRFGLKLDVQIEGRMKDKNWEVLVTRKIEDGDNYCSPQVRHPGGRIQMCLDDRSNIVFPRDPEDNNRRHADTVHEFMHIMSGGKDEYSIIGNDCTVLSTDRDSVLAYGDELREHHFKYYRKWLDKQLEKLGIE
jgi:hypothetical protein